MDSYIAHHYWIIYCWRGVEDYDIDYMKKVWRIAGESEEKFDNVILEEMRYDTKKRLWDQMANKISELEDSLKLNEKDIFLFIVSNKMLCKKSLKKEQAYSLKCVPHYPDKDKQLIGLMCV
jgi:hypothetical protein